VKAVVAGLVVVVATSASAVAVGDEEDPRCKGEHGLWSPLPDACLGLIDTDRPHQTDTPHVVAAGHFQFESAPAELQLGGLLNDRSGDRSAHLVLFDDNYKVGLVSRVDVQLLFTHAAYDPSGRSLLPPGPFGVRAKFNIVEESGWIPAITLVPWVFLPVAPSEVFRAGPYVFWGWELGEHFELEMNAGVLFGAKPKPPVAEVLASALTYKTFGVFVDIYTTGPDAALGTGMLWAFTRDMQIDLGTYVGVHGAEPVATPFIGFSIRR
jgi:Putative MetA-pathway of phenol degradation